MRSRASRKDWASADRREVSDRGTASASHAPRMRSRRTVDHPAADARRGLSRSWSTPAVVRRRSTRDTIDQRGRDLHVTVLTGPTAGARLGLTIEQSRARGVSVRPLSRSARSRHERLSGAGVAPARSREANRRTLVRLNVQLERRSVGPCLGWRTEPSWTRASQDAVPPRGRPARPCPVARPQGPCERAVRSTILRAMPPLLHMRRPLRWLV